MNIKLTLKEMSFDVSMRVDQPYFDYIFNGIKPVEGRKASPTWSGLKVGDIMEIYTIEHNEDNGIFHRSFRVMITNINYYLPLEDNKGDGLTRYLENEGLNKTLPGVTTIEEGRKIYMQWSTQDEIDLYGFMAIHLRVL